jgi:hypothetical protein
MVTKASRRLHLRYSKLGRSMLRPYKFAWAMQPAAAAPYKFTASRFATPHSKGFACGIRPSLAE